MEGDTPDRRRQRETEKRERDNRREIRQRQTETYMCTHTQRRSVILG